MRSEPEPGAGRGAEAEAPVGERFSALYEELRSVAGRHFRQQSPGHTLQPTALVNEAFLRLAEAESVRCNDDAHLRAIAATAMRQILVDHARRRGAAKRGGGGRRLTFDERLAPGASTDVGVLELDDALRKLGESSERKARVVELRFFGGLSIVQTADVLGVSHMTVSDDWRFAKAWLARELADDPQP